MSRGAGAGGLLAWLLTLALVSAPVWAGEFERGLLWKIWRPGVAPSYLFGTMHSTDTRLHRLPEPVERAFAASRRFVTEMSADEWTAARFFEAGQLPPQVSLDGLITEPMFETLAGLLGEAGWKREQVARFKPWAALLSLSTATPRDGDATTLDRSLYIKARFANMRVEELDSVEEQIAVFEDLPVDTQIALLESYVALHRRLPELAERTLRAYLARDLGKLNRLSRFMEGSDPTLKPHHAILHKKVIHDRSVVMAHRLEPYLRRGQTFAAVGALHLHGPKGMLGLLRQGGWRVARVY